MKLKQLTPEEKRVIEEKGTEAPFSGEYDKLFSDGVYVCRRCGAPLYRSEDKFEAHCGWPSFEAEIPGAVKQILDADGRRTEITCVRCGAHLGHVFMGEKTTKKDVRHCVNSLSMKFLPKEKITQFIETAYFGGGCFWCTEATFRQLKGVLSVVPGYAGGNIWTKNEPPTYKEVSGGKTGQAEVVKVQYDPTLISYEMLLNVFFASHNPTTINQQGADIGSQYRSIILFDNEDHKESAERYINQLEEENVFEAPIVTQLQWLGTFYEAEKDHQQYFEKNLTSVYCQAVITPKIAKLREKFKNILK